MAVTAATLAPPVAGREMDVSLALEGHGEPVALSSLHVPPPPGLRLACAMCLPSPRGAQLYSAPLLPLPAPGMVAVGEGRPLLQVTSLITVRPEVCSVSVSRKK